MTEYTQGSVAMLDEALASVDRNKPGSPAWLFHAARVAPLLVSGGVLLAVARAMASHRPWMIFFEDDFFYYLKIAQNLAHGSGSTFNGIVRTNGYHPLWLLLLTGLSALFPSPATVFPSIAGVVLVSTMATFALAAKLLQQAAVPYALRQGLAAYVAIYALHLFYTGMEIILAVPLVFLAMVLANCREYWQRGFWPAASLGLALSAMILARLDLILFAGLMLILALAQTELRQSLTLRQGTGLILGLTPLAAYFLVNHISFATWLPVSGMAKQLKFNHRPALLPWLTVYSPNLFNLMNLIPIHLAIVALPFVWKRLSAMQRVLFPAALLFPFFYVFCLSCLSDWRLWLWYLYPLRAALCVSFALFWIWPATRRILQANAVAMLILLIVTGEVAVSKWWTDAQPPMQAAAVDLQEFSRTHPGTYAMGDRSGMVGYLLSEPIVQTEGLVMDRAYLERIRRQEPLLTALRDFHVRYYIGTAWVQYAGCFHAVEPFQAGPASAHMEGDFCSKPAARFQHDQFETVVFDLNREAASPRR